MTKNYKKILYFLLVSHLIIWTIIPSIFNENLPLDTIEGLAYGTELSLGYDKWPPILPLITELFYLIFGSSDWAYYLLSQIFVISSFFVVFKFSKYFLKDDFQSLVSVMLLESIYFFNYITPELNAFIPLFLFLSITSLFCWRSICFNKNSDWILFGIFAGISTLTYYLALYLLGAISIFFIREIILKKNFNNKYLFALLAYLIILTPHLYFIFINDFKTIEYALFRSFGDPLSTISGVKILHHLYYPLIFLFKQFLILLPMLLIIRLIISKYEVKINFKDEKLIFLFSITFLPIILMFLTSIIGGIRIRTMWMTCFYIFPGIFFVYLFNSNLILNRLKYFFAAFLFLFFALPTAYGIDSYIHKDKRTDFPGKKIANQIQNSWDKNFSNKISIVAGNGWVYGGWYAGNLSYHLKDRPKLKYEIEKNVSKNTGTIWVDVLNDIKSCEGLLLKIEPYFESCLVGKK